MSEAFPDIPLRSYRLELNQNKARTESLFTRQRQVVSIGAGTADRWEGTLTTSLLTEAQAKTFFNFLVKVGLYGEFTFEIPTYSGPTSGQTLGAVVGGSQTGKSLDCDGFTASITVAEEGDYIQVRNQFLRLTSDAVSNASGEVTFAFEPALRVSPADNDPVDLGSPVILAELTSAPNLEMDFRRVSEFTIAWQEVLSSV